MKSAILAAIGIAASGALATSALADGHLEKSVKARQGFMQVVSFQLGPLVAMAKGEMDYNAELAADNAKNLVTLSTMNTGAMWPEGSDNEALGKDKTNALPAAWATESKVMEKHEGWAKASADLVAVAGDGLDAMRPAVVAVGKSCGGCHDDYRAEKK